MKKIYKVITSLVTMLIIIMIATNIFGADLIISGIDSRKDLGSATSGMLNMGNAIFTIISMIGSVISVVMLVVIGIKYMMGSTSERAEYKKTLMPYLIGAILLFGATSIAKIIYDFGFSL